MAQCDGFQKHPENINRNGRPKGKSLNDALREAVSEETREAIAKDIVARAKKAVKGDKDFHVVEFLFDRIEGKPRQVVEQTNYYPDSNPVADELKAIRESMNKKVQKKR